MAASITQAFSNFLQSLTGIGISIFYASFAVFQAILALFKGLFQNIIQLVQAFITLGLDLFQGVFGFVTGTVKPKHSLLSSLTIPLANFVILGVLGGGYYWYTNRQGRARGRGSTK